MEGITLYRLKKILRRAKSFEIIVPLVTIIIGILGSIGLLDKLAEKETILIAVSTLLAIEMLVQRLGILSDIKQEIKGNDNEKIRMLPRTNKSYQRFRDYAQNAKEVFIIGIDLAFMANPDSAFVKASLSKGVTYKILMCDPNSCIGNILDQHDERNSDSHPHVHNHLKTAADSLEVLKSFAADDPNAKIEIRARADIPSLSLTMIDAESENGSIRVEIKPYKNNMGNVPFFILDKESYWYPIFVNHYYHKLWNDSLVLYSSFPPKE
jgi:hypothetical protein